MHARGHHNYLPQPLRHRGGQSTGFPGTRIRSNCSGRPSLAARNAAQRPSLALVRLDHIGERRRLASSGRFSVHLHESVGAIHELYGMARAVIHKQRVLLC